MDTYLAVFVISGLMATIGSIVGIIELIDYLHGLKDRIEQLEQAVSKINKKLDIEKIQ